MAIPEEENQQIDEAITSGQAQEVQPLRGRSLFSAQAATLIDGEDPRAFMATPVNSPIPVPQDNRVLTQTFESASSDAANDKVIQHRARFTAMFNNDLGRISEYEDQFRSGDISEFTRIQDMIRNIGDRAQQEAAVDVIMNPDLTQREKVIQLDQIAKGPTPSFSDNAAVSLAEQATTRNETEKAKQEERTQLLKDRRDEKLSDFALRERIDRAKFDDNPGEDFIAALVLPALYGTQTYEILNKVFPEIITKDDFLGAVAPGKIIQDYKTYINNLWRTDRTLAEKKVIELIDAISGNEIFGHSNGAVNFWMFQSLIDGIEDNSEFDRVVESLFGVLDTVAVGQLVSDGSQFFRGLSSGLKGEAIEKAEKYAKRVRNVDNHKTPGGVSDKIDKASPKESAEFHTAILESDDPDAYLALINEERVNVVDSHIGTRPDGSEIMGVPDLTNSLTVRFNEDKQASLLSPEDIQVGADRVASQMQDWLNIRGEFHTNKSVFRLMDDGVEVTGVYGMNKEQGWRTLEEVNIFIDDLPDHAKTDPIALVRDTFDDTIKPVNEVPLERRASDYYLQVKQQDVFLPSDSAHQIGLKGGLSNWYAKYFDKSSYLDNLTARAENVADDKTANVHKTLSTIKEPFTSLGAEQRSQVARAIDDGDKDIAWYQPSDLRKRWADRRDQNKLINAYYAVVAHNRAARQLIVDATLKGYRARGVKIVDLGGDYKNMKGVVLDELPKNLRQVFDPESGKILNITELQYEELVNKGGGFVKLDSTFLSKVDDTDLPLSVEYSLSKGANIREVDHTVIPDVDGYLTRIYDANYRVVEIKKAVRQSDGKIIDYPKVIGMARNSGEGDRWVQRLKTANPGKLYERQDLTELHRTQEVLGIDEVINSGSRFFEGRGPELKDLNGDRIVVTPSERIKALTDRASRASHVDFIVQKAMMDFEHLFPEHLVEGKVPLFGKIKDVPNANAAQKKRTRDARALRDRILIITGNNPTALSRWWEEAAVGASEKLISSASEFPHARRTAERVGNWVVNKKDGSIFDPFKRLAFANYIAAAPFRQFLLQSQQLSLYLAEDHAIKYVASFQFVRDQHAMWMGFLLRDSRNWDSYLPTLAKQAGRTPEEYTKFIDTIRGSGMFANIDSHAFADGLVSDLIGTKEVGKLRGLLDDAARTSKGAFKLLRKLGFDPGEAFQLGSGILVQINRWQKQNPGKADQWHRAENYAEIFGRARALAGNMTKSGQLAFQKGPLGFMMQFQSHNWKMRQMLFPPNAWKRLPKKYQKLYEDTFGKVANKEWTNRQWLSILLTQSSIYGAGAFGAYSVWDSIKEEVNWPEIERDYPEFAQIIDQGVKEGIVGTAINGAINLIDDNEFFESTVDASGNLGPMSGITQHPMSRMFESQATGLFDFRQFPGAQNAIAMYQAADVISSLIGSEFAAEWYDSGTGLPADTNLALAMLDTASSYFSTMNKVQRARTGMALERIMSSSGHPKVRARAGEIWADLFGIKSTTDRQVYDAIEPLEDRYIKGRGGELGEIRDQAKWLYDTTLKLLQAQTTGDQIPDYQTVSDTAMHLAQFHRLMYWDKPLAWDDLKTELSDRIEEHYIGSLGNTSNISTREETLHELLQGQNYIPNMDSKLEEFRNMEDFEKKDDIIRLLEQRMQ